ncbi:MAG: alpha-ketoglutarate-dependent dioxygenase AlkB family protein [Acidimicrobiales bacterium]
MLPGWLDPGLQRRLAASCRRWADEAGGLVAPRMPRGGVMSVRMTCLGWHWTPYRYSRTDDLGNAVAPFPEWLGTLSRRAVTDALTIDPGCMSGSPDGSREWSDVAAPFEPDVALVNWYGPGARMGMHVDRDEPSPAAVVSLSIGDTCVFRFGNSESRGRPWKDLMLESGDVVVFGGAARRAYHGVPRVLDGTASPECGVLGGRFNVTVRQVGIGGATTPDGESSPD